MPTIGSVPPSPAQPPWLPNAPSRPVIRRTYLVAAGLLFIVAVVLVGTVGGLGSRLTAAGPSPTPTTPLIGGPAVVVSPSPTPAPGATPAVGPDATSTPDQTASPAPTPTPVPLSDPPEKLTGYVWPLRDARLSSAFGTRADGFVVVDGKRIHDGMDLATWCGDKIRAAHDGVVLYAGRKFDPYLGYSDSLDRLYARVRNLNNFPVVVVIDDRNGYRSVYVHLSVAKVGAGDVVEAGQVIGLEGATGRASGCHLHYSLIRMDGSWQDVTPTHHALYPAKVRPRVDPFIVLPLGHAHAPERVRQRYFRNNPTEPPVRPYGSD